MEGSVYTNGRARWFAAVRPTGGPIDRQVGCVTGLAHRPTPARHPPVATGILGFGCAEAGTSFSGSSPQRGSRQGDLLLASALVLTRVSVGRASSCPAWSLRSRNPTAGGRVGALRVADYAGPSITDQGSRAVPFE